SLPSLAALPVERATRSSVRRALMVAASCVLALGLASCGGGTSQVEAFVPQRLITLGDDMSAFTPDGRKYAINGFAAGGTTPDCRVLPIWTQVVASAFGFGFAECPVGTGEQKALSRAFAGARVADLKAQVQAQVAAGGFAGKDLVTVMIGTHDVRDLYLQSKAASAPSREALLQAARERGVEIARQVNAVVDLGAKVIVTTIPDVGLSPWGIEQGADGAALLKELTAALNGRIRVNILNDGRFVGLVLADEMSQTAARIPAAYSLTDASTAACTVAPPACTSATLRANATADGWFWADSSWLATGGHRQLGALAEARARLNPF
ncbi:MAG: SGNH/GDSL hydrolase family protein, partial [Rubrivivax sp.]